MFSWAPCSFAVALRATCLNSQPIESDEELKMCRPQAAWRLMNVMVNP